MLLCWRLRGGSATESSTSGSSLELPSPFADSASWTGTTCSSQANSCASPLAASSFCLLAHASGSWFLLSARVLCVFIFLFLYKKKGIFQILNKTNSAGLSASCLHPSYFVSVCLSSTQCQKHLLPPAWLVLFYWFIWRTPKSNYTHIWELIQL